MRVITLLIITFVYVNCDSYITKRDRILELESQIALGGNTTISEKESIANNCLMKHKFAEVDYGFHHPEFYNFSRHFFKYKDKITESKVYQIIKAMPKGALLHVHDTAVLGADYLLNITYMEHLYVCFGTKIQFFFSNTTPNVTCDNHWQLMSEARRNAMNITKFDVEIRKLFTMVVPNPDVAYPTTKETWARFLQHFGYISGLLSFKPVLEQYLYDVLKTFREDKIMYAELRGGFNNLYDLNGTVYDKIALSKLYKTVFDKFITDYPDFFGARIIFASSRREDLRSVEKDIQTARVINKVVPDLIVGYDIVGQEDLRPLIEYVPVLEKNKDFNFFFHAGETNWFGTVTDNNLIDAVLLGAKRIGHAYALTKHPEVMKLVIEKDIALEMNVLSNAVLSLVRDVRNHPLSVLLSLGLPIVLSSDDPGVWEAAPLSDDFYVAFVGVASRSSDLRMLKTLALNSLKYSALDNVNKEKAVRAFHVKWNDFIDNFNCSLY